VLGQVLGVADIGEDGGKGAELAAFGHRNGDAALDHESQKPQGLQSHRLAAGVGAGNDEKAPFRGQFQIDGHHVPSICLAAALLDQEGMAGLAEIDAAFRAPDGFPGPELLGKPGLGLNGVQFGEDGQGEMHIVQIGPQEVGEPAQHRLFFPFFPVVEEVQGVVVLHHGQGLEIEGGLGLGLVVDDAGDGALVVGLDRNDVAAVALGNDGILQDVLIFRGKKTLFDLTVDALPGFGQFPAHLGQAGAGLIQNKIMGADALGNGLGQRAEVPEAVGERGQARGQIAPQLQVVLELPGEAQHLQDVGKGLGRQQAAPHGGSVQPGGQQGKIGEGQGPLAVLQLAQLLKLPEGGRKARQIGARLESA